MSEVVNIKQYPICIHFSQEDNCYLAEAPDLPGCITQGETAEEAVRELQITMKAWIDSAIECNWKIPEPSTSQ